MELCTDYSDTGKYLFLIRSGRLVLSCPKCVFVINGEYIIHEQLFPFNNKLEIPLTEINRDSASRNEFNYPYQANFDQYFAMLGYYIVCFICFLTEIDLTSCQFKEHIDLQKVDEIIFKNEKYNVLKPTVHIIKDHFVEFIQKRHNIDASERMFLDRNGLRHIWKGLEIPRLRSLRKAEVPQTAIDAKKTTTITSRASKGNRRRTRTTKAVVEPIKESDQILREGDTMVKTTFFCPFFGVVRMFTKVHNFDEIGNLPKR